MAKTANHLHKYKRMNLGNGYLVYKCIEPGCSHYIRTDLAFNALCACNRCGNAMVMTKKAMTLARPHCEDCTKTKEKVDLSKISEFLEDRI